VHETNSPLHRMNIQELEDNLVSTTAKEDQLIVLGGTLHVFRGCIEEIYDSIFCGNGGLQYADVVGTKGALYIESPSCGLQLNRTFFGWNSVQLHGGAVQVHYSHATRIDLYRKRGGSAPTLFTTCTALQIQSAVQGTTPVINSCIFQYNHAGRMGGALHAQSVTGSLLITRSIFDRNTACEGGGAVAFVSTSHTELKNCIVARNSAVIRGCRPYARNDWSLGKGGGVWQVLSSGPVIEQRKAIS
jgi:hypothetical protein